MNMDLLLLGASSMLALAVITGFLPVVATKLIVRLYPKGDPRRAELVAELLVVPFRDRPAWVLQCLALGMTEGLPSRLRQLGRSRSSVGRRTSAAVVVRAFDVVFVLVAVPVLVPFVVLVVLAIRLDSPGPALFRSLRVGRGGSEFALLKFRTMVADAGPAGGVAESPFRFARRDPQVSRVGRFLRATSLDELPQLWNVLTGDMSLVGSRPLSPSQMRYFERPTGDIARPGLTGDWHLSREGTWEVRDPQFGGATDPQRPRQYLAALSRTAVWGWRELLLRAAVRLSRRMRGAGRRHRK